MNKTKIDITKGNSPYEGWGTALKPAMELWTLCRKPLSEKTIAKNVLKWGTGGINIDGCRVEGKLEGDPNRFSKTDGGSFNKFSYAEPVVRNEGRFPANLIHDGSDEVVRLFPETKSGKIGKQHTRHTDGSPNGIYGKFNINHELGETYGDSGSASRFFKSCSPENSTQEIEKLEISRLIYTSKASKSERNKGLEGFEKKFTSASEFRPNHMKKTLEGEGGNPYGRWKPVKNNYPTVKPIKLMRYLCRLITPKGGIVLDPFMGSGSTGIGAKLEEFDFIGIELDPDYCKIAEARISAWEKEPEQNKLV